jgi:serine/threonine protein kinase
MPSRLGRYAVRRRIGAGGFATVWLAYDEQLDSPVAVKVLADNWTEDHHIRARFQEEGRFLRKVESPHVVSVYDAGELDDGRPYLVMSYADQGTLADRLEVEGLTVTQAMEVVRQVGAGLQALHQHHVLHRDVKPANVLFRTVDAASGSGHAVRAMIGDLGLGKAIDVSSRLTMIAGTPTFVAPEQALGEHLDARADLYSLAALTYLMFTGRAPYSHATLAAAGAPGQPPSLSSTDRAFPAEVEEVVRRGLAPDREDRWPDVASYVGALQRAVGDTAADTPPDAWLPVDPLLTQPGARPSPPPVQPPLAEPALPHRRSRRLLLAVVAVVALAGGVAGGLALERSQRGDVTVSDDDGTISVTVPYDWERAVAPGGWQPPNDSDEFPALSVGTSEDWAAGDDADDQGVFVGLLPGEDLPSTVPQHDECASSQTPVTDETDGDRSVTVVWTECPTGVTVERVVQVTDNRLLWIQVRSEDRATANAVLDSVDLSGF